MTAIATITEGALYRLLTWLSPAFPTGAFSYSHGIEYAVEVGLIIGRDDLVEYVAAALERGSARADAALLVAAWTAARDGDGAALDKTAALAAAWRGSAELAQESEVQGRAFLGTVTAAWPHPGLGRLAGRAVALPVALGAAAALHGIALPPLVSGYLHGFAANLVSAAIRLIPLGQTDGQRALAALESVVASAAAAALTVPLAETDTCAPVIDWCSMRHETQYTRLFRS